MKISDPNKMTITELVIVSIICGVVVVIEDGVAKFKREGNGVEQNQN